MKIAGWLVLFSLLTGLAASRGVALSSPDAPAGSEGGTVPAAPHEGPDPVGHWFLEERFCQGTVLQARLGPEGHFTTAPLWDGTAAIRAAVFEGGSTVCRISPAGTPVQRLAAGKPFTVVAVVAIDSESASGQLVSTQPAESPADPGWALGLDAGLFTFQLNAGKELNEEATTVRLTGRTRWQPGQRHHVTAVSDGETAELFVDGQLEASAQIGSLSESARAWELMIGGAGEEDATGWHGRIREVALFDRAARARWVQAEALRQFRVDHPALRHGAGANQFVVEPFLQFGTQDGMTVIWQLEQAGAATLHWGPTEACDQRIDSPAAQSIHQVRISGLSAETQYFFRVTAGEGALASEVRTFQTACRPGTPVAFAVIGDTQERPQIARPVAELAWAQRPQFLLLAGDLVDNGEENSDWTEQFFPSLSPLISRVPLFPVLGNHEKNARNYFDYMALPDPEYCYQFSYGDADFFMIDSNRNVDPDSEQYRWLDQALGESRAIWKFVCHHHPPYSSDENDYGDLWKTNQSTRGDLRVRQLVPLYEKHHVDIVWTGHIHSYERTWPIRENAAVTEGGTIYVVTGGGGGTLETPAPSRPFFQNNVRHGHHYCMVALHRGVLELKAYTLDDRLFDSLRIEKPQ
jgi:3',5'-cyclic AMP phosphodiesterase CpdA